MSLENSQAAMCDFLQQAVPPMSAADFPDTIELPPMVAAHSLKAVSHTSQDHHERSVNFLYRSARWHAGTCTKGTSYNLTKDGEWYAHTNTLHSIVNNIRMPELRIHTHPPISLEVSEAAVAHRSRQNKWDNMRTELEAVLDWNKMQVRRPVPSWQDVRTTYALPKASLGYMVATDEQSFLWLHSKPIDRSFRYQLLDQPFNETDKLRQGYIKIEDLNDEIYNESHAYQKAVIARAIASLLHPMFVCYQSDMPLSPYFTKLKA